MKNYYRWVQAEIFKLIHSPLLYVHLGIPIVAILVFNGYYLISFWEEAQKVSTYLQVLAIAFPMMIAVITSMCADREGIAGNFQAMRSNPGTRCIPYLASLTVLLLFGLLASTLAVFGFGMVFRMLGNDAYNLAFYSQVSFLLLIGNIPLYVLHTWLSFQGKGMNLGLGMIGSLLSALLLTGLGDSIWNIMPWGIGVRLVSLATLQSTTLNSFAILKPACSALILIPICLIFGMIYWSNRWEGRKNEE